MVSGFWNQLRYKYLLGFAGMYAQLARCRILETPTNGKKNGSGSLVGSVIKFSCNDGFHLRGSAQRRCTESGTWDGEDTLCK